MINCGGLQSDRIARAAGAKCEAKIIPFRGEYYELVPEKRYLVKSLIYPVPDPTFPFLGLHFTRMIDGSVHAVSGSIDILVLTWLTIRNDGQVVNGDF